MITIESKEFMAESNAWHVQALLATPSGTRRGLHSVELAEDASDDAIKAAILALYDQVKSK
jgi:hypothetical protein